MKKCPVCGVEHADTSKICSICGSPLSGDAVKPAAPAPTQAPPAAPAPEQAAPAAPAAPDFAAGDIQAAVSSIVSQAVSDAEKGAQHKPPEHSAAPAPEAPKPADDDPFDDDSPFVVNAMRTRREKAESPAQPAQPKPAGRNARKPASRPRPARPAAARSGADGPAASPKPAAARESAARPAAARPAADRHQPPAGSERIDTTAVAAASAQKVQQAKQNAMAAKARTTPPAPPEGPGEEDFNWSERKHPRRKAKSSTPVIAAVCALLALIIIAMIVLIGRLVSGDGDTGADGNTQDNSISDTDGDETGDGAVDGGTVTPDDSAADGGTGDAEVPDDGTTPDDTGDAEAPDDGTADGETGDIEVPDGGTADGETGDAGDAEAPDGGAADGETGDAGGTETPDDGAADGDASSEGGSTEQPALPEITEVSDTVYATASLRVRDYPGTSGAVINSLTAGQAVTRTGRCSNGWSRVEIGGVTGYVSERYLSATPPDTSADSGSGSDGGSTSLDGITITEVNETVYTTAGVNVRNYPGSSGSVIATVAEGQAVTRTGRCSNGWSRVSVNGATGYIYSSYLSGAQSGGGSGSDGGSTSLDGITVTEVNETVYATTGVNVRSYPGSSGSVINVLTRGQSVTRTGRCSNGWSRVSVGGVTGYVYSGYLSTSQSGSDSGSGSGSGGTNSSYILPDSDSRYYSRSELSSLSASELRLARNEIYARNGRRFSDSSLQEYFNSKSWYSGTVDPDTFDANVNQYLNAYELANLLLIIELENG